MAKNDWRSFAFFDLRPDADGGRLAAALQNAHITATATGHNRIVVGDSDGRIHCFDSNWHVTATFRAHAGPVLLCQLAGTGSGSSPSESGSSNSANSQQPLLVTVGQSDDRNPLAPQLCCWNLAKPVAATTVGAGDGVPLACIRTAQLAAQPVSLAVSDNGQCMAVGYANAAVQLFRTDTPGKSALTPWSRSAAMEALDLKCPGAGTIVGMAFKLAHKTLQLFVCGEHLVAVFVLPGAGLAETLVVLDRLESGKRNRCSVMQRPEQTLGGGTLAERHFMAGHDDAVYCYNSDGRGPCYALKGDKLSVHWFRSHLITVYQSDKSQNLTVIDIQNNVIGYEERIADVAAVCLAFGTCYVLTADRRVLHLDERDFRTKLNLLFKQGLYDIGVRIAKNNQYDDEGLAEIFKRYGDHLVQRGKHAEACQQYTKTIGYLEPSYVIRAFLDPRHIEHMVDYLKALHAAGVATANHTTLLLNCFTRLNRTDQLQDFLHVSNGSGASDGNGDGDTFDVDVAISVCRTTAPDVALTLARQHGRHAAYLAIQVEDRHAYVDAVAYMGRLPFDACEANARQFGAVLMEHCADEMTRLLCKLCTFYAPIADDDDEDVIGLSNGADVNVMRLLLDDAAATNGDGGATESEHSEQRLGQRADAVSLMHLFGKRPDRMVAFLEHLVANVSTPLPQAIYNALIELYAASLADGSATVAAEVEPKIMDVLRNHGDECDLQQALVLCRLYEFWPAVMYIYEEQGLHRLVVRHHLRQRDYAGLLACCMRLGGEQPDVWFQALNGLRTDAECPAGLLAEILQKIAHGKHRSPLQVLDCLAVEGGPKLDAVRDYFQLVFGKENGQIRRNEEKAREHAASAAAQKREIEALTGKSVEFRSTKCMVCWQPLTMPAVYFLCKDSFHQDCLPGGAEHNMQCPVCTQKPETQQLADAMRSQSESRQQHGTFHDLLDHSPEPFELLAKFFQLGLFNQLVDENEPVDINKNLPDEPAPMKPAAPAAVAVAVHHGKPPPAAKIPYGHGAEASVRAQEAHHMRQEESIRRQPLPEARMRLQEASKAKDNLPKASAAAPAFRVPQKKSSAPISRPMSSGRSIAVAVDRAYDPTKNPFGEDDEAAAGGGAASAAKEATTLNPFGDCDDDDDEEDKGSVVLVAGVRKPLDKNLNPFE